MSAARWDRLVQSLAAVDTTAKVTERSYPGGVSRSIYLNSPDNGRVVVIDTWWRKNPDIWTGWLVTDEGADSLIRSERPATKRRGDVVRAVQSMLAPVKAAS